MICVDEDSGVSESISAFWLPESWVFQSGSDGQFVIFPAPDSGAYFAAGQQHHLGAIKVLDESTTCSEVFLTSVRETHTHTHIHREWEVNQQSVLLALENHMN